VSTNEELIGRERNGSGLENRDYGAEDEKDGTYNVKNRCIF
jgi:hypothetical protein